MDSKLSETSQLPAGIKVNLQVRGSQKMNPSVLGVFYLVLCVQSRSLHNEHLNALDLSENRDLFLSALQAYFSRRGIHVDRTAPSFIILSSKPRISRASLLDEDRLLETQVTSGGSKKDIQWENFF